MPGAVKQRVGFVPQQDELLDPLMVRIRSISSHRSIRTGTGTGDELCRRLEYQCEARIKTMSVGERQKLSILLAFGQRPDL